MKFSALYRNVAVGLGAIGLATGVMTNPGPASAAYPEKPIEWIIMWSAGGGADTATRTFLKYFEQVIGQKVVVRNVTGAGGTIGYLTAKQARPDGYTLVSALSDLPKYKPLGTKGIEVDDFDILGGFAVEAPILVAKADAPWKDPKAFEEDAKANPDKLSIGVSNIGGVHHQPIALWMDDSAMRVKVVAHHGSPEMNAALLGGHVDIISSWVKQSLSNVKAGDLKFLGYFGSERLANFPDVPTFKELGYDIVWEHSYGMGAPQGIPEEAKAVLTEGIKKVWAMPEFEKDLNNLGLSLYKKNANEYREDLLNTESQMDRVVKILSK
ncbi:MAG: tripartite tricarboxylate transporter substrate binding protein [Rhodospirillales bacterium]|jgi:tripartite-type tricarboxylate transporter receptor subunit TctC|nr:tripartite tricarboxylate transporter substrate binding protein [Rhodospirillales bacterium]